MTYTWLDFNSNSQRHYEFIYDPGCNLIGQTLTRITIYLFRTQTDPAIGGLLYVTIRDPSDTAVVTIGSMNADDISHDDITAYTFTNTANTYSMVLNSSVCIEMDNPQGIQIFKKTTTSVFGSYIMTYSVTDDGMGGTATSMTVYGANEVMCGLFETGGIVY